MNNHNLCVAAAAAALLGVKSYSCRYTQCRPTVGLRNNFLLNRARIERPSLIGQIWCQF